MVGSMIWVQVVCNEKMIEKSEVKTKMKKTWKVEEE